MSQYKHIEQSIGDYIASRYRRVVEVGIGNNPVAARLVEAAGALMLCTDIRPGIQHEGLTVVTDDIFEPDTRLYQSADVIYSVRPGVEMVPPLILLAARVNCDLLVYHLGCEIYEDGGEVVDAGGVQLHLYYRHRS